MAENETSIPEDASALQSDNGSSPNAPLLGENTTRAPSHTSQSSTQTHATARSTSIKRKLYISHFLSTWNSRMFEFGAVLFLVAAFPGTLLYTSAYALVRSLAVALLSSALGRRIDRFDRLKVLRSSIVWQRIPVAASCLIILLLLSQEGVSLSSNALFACASLLACVEKLASVANTVAVERDWVVIISDSLEIPRQDLNASMRRIDLFCKLIAPLFISFIDSYSTKVAVCTVFGLSTVWVVVEYLAIAQVYNAVPELKIRPTHEQSEQPSTLQPPSSSSSSSSSSLQNLLRPWREYASSPVFLASFSLSLLYLTVLSFAPQMITYLLYTGFTPLQVSCMRIAAVISELCGTMVAPAAMRRVGPVRAGLWFINWQFGSLAAAAGGFLFFDNGQVTNSKVVAVCLIVGVTLSRLGLWGFDLNVQYLVQKETTPTQRAQFSSTEMALQSVFEMLSFACTIVFARPEQFKYPVLRASGAYVAVCGEEGG
ncbi:Solute carrier family 40 member 1 [Talaromyces islandicus]|uniref:Solute carrier family 40 member n=1 Tax=Talaromyces islandicus TaxID=28573 RepID=A0A0U1LQA0_TALIS|nr:Solute carrier family 40 member 1 [Talaromyces islandicus]